MKKNKLHNIKTTGYKTPNSYFDSFEDKLNKHLKEKGTIKTAKSSGYTVPKNYFKTVDDKVFKTLKETDKPVVILNKKSWYYITSIAASILIALAIFTNGPSNNEISIEMLEAYFEDNDLSSYELAQLLDEADLLENDFVIIETPYEEENLESYLLDNVDIETYLK